MQSSVREEEGPLRFGVLGPLTVHRGTMPIHLAAARHRMVLGVLLAKANCVVSSEQLIDELWPGMPPLTARKTIQGYVWRIRRGLRLPSSQLTTIASGYRLSVTADSLDALEFEHLTDAAGTALSDGRREHAATLLSEALGRWRGLAFDCIPAAPALQAEAARLNEAKLKAYEDLVTVRIGMGQCSGVIPRLTGMVSAYPHRESMHRLLMIALYLDGRPLDALDVFARFRRTAAAEYGLDPHRETTLLHEKILQGVTL
ncbi:AfsR/SARP family transcriptional regulator [Actinomadura rugatobispora]|uniref:BTAD domain-containing putative transcriptional regulator n=1 Tax=Actinomadura rugatobispora TaxID=1994 RepID=A0ABW0ZQX8_9ACTN